MQSSTLKPSWGVGMLVAVLLSAAVYLVGVVSLAGMLSMILLLAGLWTVVTSFMIVEQKDRGYYLGWGVVIAALSLFYFIPLNYTIALILIAIVALIVINVYIGREPKIIEAATTPTPAGGGTPAAT